MIALLADQCTLLRDRSAFAAERQAQMVSVVSLLKSLELATKVEFDGKVLVVYGCTHSDDRRKTAKKW